MSGLSDKLGEVLKEVHAFQEQHSDTQGWDVYPQGASHTTGLSASPRAGTSERTMPQSLYRAIEAAFERQQLEMGTYFRVRNTEHEATPRR